MIKKETIGDVVFLEQRTFYIYKSESDWEKGLPSITMSSQKEFNKRKREAKKFNKA